MSRKKNRDILDEKEKVEKEPDQEDMPVGGEDTPSGDEDSTKVVSSGDDAAVGEKMEENLSEDDILKKRLEECEAEMVDLKDQMLRKQAELDNFRKRILKDKEDSVKYANANLLTDLIAIIDDFERAIQSSANSRDFDSFHSGIELIEKQFTGMLEKKWGLTRISSVGEEFNPSMHEAIGMEESPEYKTEIVIEDYQKGYILHGRVLRPAKVKVGVPPRNTEEVSDDEEKLEETVAEDK